MPQEKITVRQAVERFVNKCRSRGIGQEWDLDNMLDRVCAVRGSKPDDDGADVWRDLSGHLKECAKQGKIAERANDGVADEPRKNDDGPEMGWSDVGPGTDPIRYLTRPDPEALRTASYAKREHHGRG